jgi:hypothetical protein
MVIHKRGLDDIYTNNYNDTFLEAWQANMDLQFCLDQYSVVSYICDYMTKDDSGLTEVLQKALKDCDGCSDFEKLNYLKQQYFKSRQIGVCEAAYRLVPGLNLKGSNVKTRFVATGYPEHRIIYFEKVCDDIKDDDNFEKHPGNESDENHDEIDEELPVDTETVVTIQGRDGKYIVRKSLHDKYSMRPKELQNICFAQFVMAYDDVKSIPVRQRPKMDGYVHSEPGDITRYDNGEGLPKYIKLTNGSVMKLRKYPYVLRLHASHKKQGNEQFYAELQLYYPWRNEKVDLNRNNEDEIASLYIQNQETIETNRAHVFPYSNTVERMKDLLDSLDDDGRPRELLDALDSTARQENEDDKEEMPEIDESELPQEAEASVSKRDAFRFKRIVLPLTEDEMVKDVLGMSEEQRIAFDMIIGYCKDIKMSRKTTWKPDPPQLIIHGMLKL